LNPPQAVSAGSSFLWYLPPQPPILTRLYYEGRRLMMGTNSIYTVPGHIY
jgi:hypothetical protein